MVVREAEHPGLTVMETCHLAQSVSTQRVTIDSPTQRVIMDAQIQRVNSRNEWHTPSKLRDNIRQKARFIPSFKFISQNLSEL